MEEQKEKELLDKLKKKDPESVKKIIHLYNKQLMALIYRFTNNLHDSEDIIQEVWINFFYSLSSFKAQSTLYTYLYRIAINESLSWLRKNKIKKLFSKNIPEIVDRTTPEDIYIQNEKWESINRAIQQLPARQKQVFILRIQTDLPFKKIAAILNIKESNAKTHYFYSLKNIRKYIKKEGLL